MANGEADSTISTYAVSLMFDAAASEAIRSLVGNFARVTGNDTLIKKDAPPHLTLGMFHAADSKILELKSLFSDFARTVEKNLSLDFTETDSFKEKVIFLSINKDSNSFSRLKNLNARLHEVFLTQFEPGANLNYLPKIFFPHVALAVKLTKKQFEKGMDWAQPSALRAPGRAIRRSAFRLHCFATPSARLLSLAHESNARS